MRHNINLNFKTEADMTRYFAECSTLALQIKSSTTYIEQAITQYVYLNGLFYFFLLTLFAIMALTFSTLLPVKQKEHIYSDI